MDEEKDIQPGVAAPKEPEGEGVGEEKEEDEESSE